MSTQHYVDSNNNYLGGFGDGAMPPEGSTEVPAPAHGLDTWDGAAWIPYVPDPVLAAIEELDITDKQIARIGEETIDILFAKGVLVASDFDAASLAKLAARKSARDKLNG